MILSRNTPMDLSNKMLLTKQEWGIKSTFCLIRKENLLWSFEVQFFPEQAHQPIDEQRFLQQR